MRSETPGDDPSNELDRIEIEDHWDKILFDIIQQELSAAGIEDPDEEGFDAVVNRTVDDTLLNAGKDLLERLKRSAPETLKDRHRVRLGFERRLYKFWARGLDALYLMLEMSMECGSRYQQTLRPAAVQEKDLIFEAQVRLHVKACQVASEIWHLLCAGYASGAHARWRTLHEITVVSLFLGSRDNDTAERYLRHEFIEAFKGMEEYQDNYVRLGYESPDPEEIQFLIAKRDELLAQYGNEFKSSHGWAAAALGMGRPTLRDIEAAVQLDHYRPLYGLANHGVHAGPRGLFFNIGLGAGDRSPLAGASNGGLAQPGHATALSLTQIWAGMVSHRSRTADVIVLHAMHRLEEEIGEEFLTASRNHEKRTRQLKTQRDRERK